MSLAVEVLFTGLSAGGVYGLVAIGHSLIYRLTGIVHFALGELIGLGAFVTLLVAAGTQPLPGADRPRRGGSRRPSRSLGLAVPTDARGAAAARSAHDRRHGVRAGGNSRLSFVSGGTAPTASGAFRPAGATHDPSQASCSQSTSALSRLPITSLSSSRPGRSSRSSARTARGRRRCCGCSPARWRPIAATSASTAPTSPPRHPPNASGAASSARCRRTRPSAS
jgi:hypothetical protein